jgi:hypothetical protein
MRASARFHLGSAVSQRAAKPTSGEGEDMLSAKISAVWIGVLGAVLLFHCVHLIRMRGESRWYHSAHIVMLLGMVYMFAQVAFGVDWLPTAAWIVLYAATTAAIAWWIVARRRLKRSSGALWLLAFAQQAAMIYMWLPMKDWVPWLSYGLGIYFGAETLGWLARAWTMTTRGAGCGAGTVSLEPKSRVNDLCMTAMAASMGYMFIGMQLMMTMPPQVHAPMAAATPASPPEPRPPAPHDPAPHDEALVPRAEIHVIAVGDTLRGLAARIYGDERAWRAIAAANPGLDPRRLPVGRAIRLPTRSGDGLNRS